MIRKPYLFTLIAPLFICSLAIGALSWTRAAAAQDVPTVQAAQAPAPTLFSHRCGEISMMAADRHLEELGGYGWELVSVALVHPGATSAHNSVFYCMKRARRPGAEAR